MMYHVFVSSNKLLDIVLSHIHRNEKNATTKHDGDNISHDYVDQDKNSSFNPHQQQNQCHHQNSDEVTDNNDSKNYHVQPLVSAMISSLYLSCSSRPLFMTLTILVLTIYYWSRRDTHSLFSTMTKVLLSDVRWRLCFHYYWDLAVLVTGFILYKTSCLLP